MASEEPTAKRQRTQPAYELLYWPSMPGRGEHVRLAFEAAGVPYSDVSNEESNGVQAVLKLIDQKNVTDEDGNPPAFAPPALRVPGGRKDGKALLIHQTPNILAYLGPKIGMVPADDEPAAFQVAQLALTALDLNDEAHDTHHPISNALYYEDQKEPALAKAKAFRKERIPKFLGYFERALKSNEERGKGKYVIGDAITYADTTWWQVIDGLYFAFPNEMKARTEAKEFPLVFETFYPSIKEEKGIKEYLASKRRLPYSMGIFRYYPELDRE